MYGNLLDCKRWNSAMQRNKLLEKWVVSFWRPRWILLYGKLVGTWCWRGRRTTMRHLKPTPGGFLPRSPSLKRGSRKSLLLFFRPLDLLTWMSRSLNVLRKLILLAQPPSLPWWLVHRNALFSCNMALMEVTMHCISCYITVQFKYV